MDLKNLTQTFDIHLDSKTQNNHFLSEVEHLQSINTQLQKQIISLQAQGSKHNDHEF